MTYTTFVTLSVTRPGNESSPLPLKRRTKGRPLLHDLQCSQLHIMGTQQISREKKTIVVRGKSPPQEENARSKCWMLQLKSTYSGVCMYTVLAALRVTSCPQISRSLCPGPPLITRFSTNLWVCSAEPAWLGICGQCGGNFFGKKFPGQLWAGRQARGPKTVWKHSQPLWLNGWTDRWRDWMPN